MEALQKILELENSKNRAVTSLVALIHDTDYLDDKPNNVKEVLLDLAHDLEYYVPDESERKEDSSYYGNDRLLREIRSALSRLENIGTVL